MRKSSTGITIGRQGLLGYSLKIKASGADIVYWGGCIPKGGPSGAADERPRRRHRYARRTESRRTSSRPIRRAGIEGKLMNLRPDPRKRRGPRRGREVPLQRNFEPESLTLTATTHGQIIKQAEEAANSLVRRRLPRTIKSGRKFPTVIGERSY